MHMSLLTIGVPLLIYWSLTCRFCSTGRYYSPPAYTFSYWHISLLSMVCRFLNSMCHLNMTGFPLTDATLHHNALMVCHSTLAFIPVLSGMSLVIIGALLLFYWHMPHINGMSFMVHSEIPLSTSIYWFLLAYATALVMLWLRHMWISCLITYVALYHFR